MFKYLSIIFLNCLFIFSGCAQTEDHNYNGNWVGEVSNRFCFNFEITLTPMGRDEYQLVIDNGRIILDRKLKSTIPGEVQLKIDDQLQLDLTHQNEETLSGFIKSGRLFYHVGLYKESGKPFKGQWHPYMLNDGLQPNEIMLYVEHSDSTQTVAFPFLADQRTRGAWVQGFEHQGDQLISQDANTGFQYRTTFLSKKIELAIYLADALIVRIPMVRTDRALNFQIEPTEITSSIQQPLDLEDGWASVGLTALDIDSIPLLRMMDSIHSNKLVNTHSVLIAKSGKLVFEAYYQGFNTHIPHDLRSASKSISSAMMGIAMDRGLIKDVDQKLYDFLPEVYEHTKDSLKAQISLHNLLTMSSGLDVNNLASEGYYQDSNNPNAWLTTVLAAPMMHVPGTYADYGSANPFLLGICLNERLKQPLETFMDEQLMAPLGITNYIIQTDDTEQTPYFGGGMFLKPRDMLKFGQLYLDKGVWKGQRILSEEWVDASFQKHVQLQDVSAKNWYGYQWWHHSVPYKGREIASIEARGAGGQFIFVLPELEAVVVITSGNFRNRRGNQPIQILNDYILPALMP